MRGGGYALFHIQIVLKKATEIVLINICPFSFGMTKQSNTTKKKNISVIPIVTKYGDLTGRDVSVARSIHGLEIT